MRYFSSLFLILFFCASANAATLSSDQQKQEQNKIQYLLNAVGSSDLIFIRNGREYKGADAKAHLQHKLNVAGSRIQTADEFIHYVASESSVTGKPYMVKKPDGGQETSEAWLREQLKNWKPSP